MDLTSAAVKDVTVLLLLTVNSNSAAVSALVNASRSAKISALCNSFVSASWSGVFVAGFFLLWPLVAFLAGFAAVGAALGEAGLEWCGDGEKLVLLLSGLYLLITAENLSLRVECGRSGPEEEGKDVADASDVAAAGVPFVPKSGWGMGLISIFK